MRNSRSITLVALAIGALAAHVRAQSALVAYGVIIASTGEQVPGTPAGCTFDSSAFSPSFQLGGIDDAGNVYFSSRLIGTGTTPTNRRACFFGSNRSNLTLVIRSEMPVPSLFGGETLNTVTEPGVGSTVRVSATGRMLWLGTFSGGTSTTANDTAVFTGTNGNFSMAAREGSPQPGTVGATFPDLSALTQAGTQLDSAGRIAFSCATVGGDTTTANNAAWFGGQPGALELIMRKGFTNPAGNEVRTLGTRLAFNASGAALHEATYSTLSSAQVPATSTNDNVLFVYVPGLTPGTGTNTELLREGDLAPGTASARLAQSFVFGASCWNNDGKAFVSCTLALGIGGTTTSNNNILYLAQIGSAPAVVMRKGDPAPGLPGVTFSDVPFTAMACSDHDQVAFMTHLQGGGSPVSNSTSIWYGTPRSLTLAVRENDPAPGTVGAVIDGLAGIGDISMSNSGQFLFDAEVRGGDSNSSNDRILYSWDPASGLSPIVREGDVIELAPGVFKTVVGWDRPLTASGDARELAFNHAGKLALRVYLQSGEHAIMSVYAPRNPGTSFCSGDGTAGACPCGNFGVEGHGCQNSIFAMGAQLTAFGTPSVAPGEDGLVLTATKIVGPGLFFQGSAQVAGGTGAAFGNGLLCAGGTIIRLGVGFPSGGTASYPGGLTPGPIHVRGATSAGDVRHYQAWYRDGAVFCTSATFNFTQGVSVTWIP